MRALKYVWPLSGLICVGLVIILIVSNLHLGQPIVRQWKMTEPNLPSMKIAVIADLHITGYDDLELFATLRKQLIREDPDLVLFLGDYVSPTPYDFYIGFSRKTIVDNLEALVGSTEAFAVLGNHENWDHRDAWISAFQGRQKLLLLENATAHFEMNGQMICIRGMGDFYSDAWAYTPKHEICEDRIITITHDPRGLIGESTNRIETLSFAGHTHCGQVVLPLIGAPFVPTKAPQDMHCGPYKKEFEGLTSGGIGTSILPIRFGPNTEPGWEMISLN